MRESNIPPLNDKSKNENHLPSSHVDPQKHCLKKPPKLDAGKNSNLKRTWISCMLDSSLNVAWQLHHLPSRKRIQLSFVWKQHPVSTDTIWWTPTGVFADDDRPLDEDVEKQLNVAFAMMKVAHCCFGCRSPTSEFADAHCWWQMPTGCWRCPLAASLMLSRLSVCPFVNCKDNFRGECSPFGEIKGF